MSNIQIKILNNEEFDGLSHAETRGADISDSLGFADVHSGKVYVRNTGVDDLNKYLINHEVSHLFEEHGTDEDPHVPGIRHKKLFKDIVAPAVPMLDLFVDPGRATENAGRNALASVVGGPTAGFGSAATNVARAGAEKQAGAFATSNQGNSTPSQGTTGSVGGSLNSGIGSAGVNSPNVTQNQNIDPELAQRVRGFYSGRPTF